MRVPGAHDSTIKHQVFKNEQRNTDENGGICDIKCRPVIGANMKIKKINDKSKSDTIDQIPDSTAGNQCQRHGIQPAVTPVTSLEQPDQNQGDQSGTNKKHLSPQCRLAGQNTEGRTVIGQIGQIEKTWQDRSAFKKKKIMKHPVFTNLVNYDGQNDDTEKPSHTKTSSNRQ